jgi:hypothetical protein
MVIVVFFLDLNPRKGLSLCEHLRDFDFLGLVLIVGGVLCLLIGLDSGETSCMLPASQFVAYCLRTQMTGYSVQTISLIVAGGVLLVASGFWECFTTRSPIIRPRLFRVGF